MKKMKEPGTKLEMNTEQRPEKEGGPGVLAQQGLAKLMEVH